MVHNMKQREVCHTLTIGLKRLADWGEESSDEAGAKAAKYIGGASAAISREETVQACPDEDCGSTQIRSLTSNINQPEPEWGWRCRDCGNEFDAPIRRESDTGHTQPPGHTVAATLLKMDPDDAGGSA